MTWPSIVRFAFRKLVEVLPEKQAIQLIYFRRFRSLPNLTHPRTFNEKIAWRKLYQRDPRLTLFSDKVAVKIEVEKLIGADHIIPNLWVGAKAEDIPFDCLEPPYVIKVNHGSQSNIFIRSREDVDQQMIVAHFREKMAEAHGYEAREWAYDNIPRKILIEPMIKTVSGEPPDDYKFLVYGGRARFIQVDRSRFAEHKETYFDTEWNKLPVSDGNPPLPQIDGDVPKPANLAEMMSIAEKIGAQFDFARVDLYNVSSHVLFGEVTFYPAAGTNPFNPPEWDLKFGEPWHITPY